ncbi:MAG TPA: hypothetical protein VMV94_12840 [Phycisphaerae bacterium]|nr:hypothetical protein [Phycisphaerae bacterium]
MSSWWTKLVAMFRGEHEEASPLIAFPQQRPADLPDESSTYDQPAAQTTDEEVASTTSQPEPSAGDRGTPDLCDLISNLIATFERHLSPLAIQAARTAELAERLLAKADSGADEARRLGENVAALREIASATAEALGNLEDSIESFDEKTARDEEQLARTAREIDEIRSKLDQLGPAMTHCLETCAEIAGHQGQMAQAFAAMRELIVQGAEVAKTSAVTIKGLADDRSNRYDELRAHLSERYRQLATRNTIALLLSAIAAIAAITAAVLIVLEHP